MKDYPPKKKVLREFNNRVSVHYGKAYAYNYAIYKKLINSFLNINLYICQISAFSYFERDCHAKSVINNNGGLCEIYLFLFSVSIKHFVIVLI